MLRISMILAGLCLLTSCFDFAGDRGQLGFSTDATLMGLDTWSPESALAGGARPRFTVTEVLSTGEAPDEALFTVSNGDLEP